MVTQKELDLGRGDGKMMCHCDTVIFWLTAVEEQLRRSVPREHALRSIVLSECVHQGHRSYGRSSLTRMRQVSPNNWIL